MTITLDKLTAPLYWSAITSTGEVIHTGRIDVGTKLQTGQANIIYHSDVNAYLDELNTANPEAPPLPEAGTPLDVNSVYAWGAEKVLVRQSHIRTEHDPDTVPALFSVYREDYEGMEWVPNEPVLVGDKRMFEDINYECIQAHTTQATYTPPATPALWSVYSDEILPWVQPEGAHDAYQMGDKVTHIGDTWESTENDNVWEPGVFGWVVVAA